MAESAEKTEKPTAKRLKQARKDGNIARSQDIGAWVSVLVASFLVEHTVHAMMANGRQMLISGQAMTKNPDPEKAMALLGLGLKAGAGAVLPLALGLMVAGVSASVLQGGFHVSTGKLKPKAERLNPFKGLKRMFGMQAGWELLKSLLKSSVVGLLVWKAIHGLMPTLIASGHLPLDVVVGTVANGALSMIRVAAIAALGLAAADYGVQWRRVRKQLMMSRKDVQDEYKQSEGDPHMKGQIRARAMALSRNRMMASVGDADVLLVNPTHVAVALKYDAARGAPRVVAKGAGVVAARLRELATEHRVPMVEDVPLARSLHKACEVGQEIPPEMYTAVARILAFVLSLKSRGSAAGMHKAPAARSLSGAHLLLDGR